MGLTNEASKIINLGQLKFRGAVKVENLSVSPVGEMSAYLVYSCLVQHILHLIMSRL